MSNVLITGLQGFVGSNLALDRLAKGDHVVGIVRDKNHKTREDVLSMCSVIQGNIDDPATVDHALSYYEIDTVFHLAANSIVKVGVSDPLSNFRTNVMGTVNVLDGVRRIRPKAKVVVASSDKAYGSHKELPYREDMKLIPEDPYSTSKACTDMISQSFAKTYGLNINTVRCSNIFGPGDMNTSRLIPNSVLRILRGERPQIYSGVLSYRREMIYVGDACHAYSLLVEKGEPGEIYNIGINQFHTIEEIVNIIMRLMSADGSVDVIQKDFPEIPFQWMDGSKLATLGWAPATSFEEGLLHTIEWYKKQHTKEVSRIESATAKIGKHVPGRQ